MTRQISNYSGCQYISPIQYIFHDKSKIFHYIEIYFVHVVHNEQ